MNKEDKELLNQLARMFAEHNKILEQNTSSPILFTTDCDACLKITVHVSHIARIQPFTNGAVGSGGDMPLHTCLTCGKVTLRRD